MAHPLIKKSLIALLVITVLLSLIRVALPFAIKFKAISWLESQDVKANIDEIKISLLDGTFAINNASGKNSNGKGFSFDRIATSWQWKPLFDHQIIIDQIEIKSLNVDSAFFDNGDMNIAGIDIKAAPDEAPTEPVKPVEQSTAAPWDATVKNILFSDIKLCLQQLSENKLIVDYCGQLSNFNWSGDASFKASKQLSENETPIYAQGSINISGIVLQNNQLKLSLLNTESIDITNINIETPTNINIDNINVTKFAALQRVAQTSSDEAQVFAFDRLSINTLKLVSLNTLSLGTIELNGSSAYLLVNKDGHMDFDQWLPEQKKKSPPEEKTKSTAESEPFHFSFKKFIFITEKHFTFIDDSLKETFTADIHNIDLSLENLDSKNPDGTSRLSLSLAIDKYGSFKMLDTDVNPLSKRPSLKGTGKVAGLDMRMLAPMTKQHIGHNIKSGQLDVDLKLDIKQGIIDSNIGLALHQFELQTLSNEEAKALDSKFGFPLNSSLSLLRDSDNTIHLDIPITGDIESPEFDPRDAIITASSKAITAAVILYYTPFGLVFAAESLFDLATALNFEPVIFKDGESKLNNAHNEQLDKLAALMTERPGIHLTLCGLSNNADKDKLFPAPVKPVSTTPEQKTASEPEPVPLSKENIAALKKLAETRSDNVKNYMVNKKTIEASRLIECAPEYSPDETSAVTISI